MKKINKKIFTLFVALILVIAPIGVVAQGTIFTLGQGNKYDGFGVGDVFSEIEIEQYGLNTSDSIVSGVYEFTSIGSINADGSTEWLVTSVGDGHVSYKSFSYADTLSSGVPLTISFINGTDNYVKLDTDDLSLINTSGSIGEIVFEYTVAPVANISGGTDFPSQLNLRETLVDPLFEVKYGTTLTPDTYTLLEHIHYGSRDVATDSLEKLKPIIPPGTVLTLRGTSTTDIEFSLLYFFEEYKN